MKPLRTELVLAALILSCLAASSLQAGLVDYSPNPYAGLSDPVTYKFYKGIPGFFDSARAFPGGGDPAGWSSRYGDLNGGTLFTTDVFNNPPSPTTLISWNLTGTDYRMSAILLESLDGAFKLFGVRKRDWQDATFQVSSVSDISQIAFYGTNAVPASEGGPGLALLAIGAVALLAVQRRSRLMATTAALAMSVASASAIVGTPCSNQDCEKTIVYPYPTKLVYRTTIAAEHTIYQATTVKIGINDSFGVSGGYLVYKGLSSGSPYGGALILGNNGTYDHSLLNNTGIPTYLTSTRDPAGTAAYQTYTNVAKSFTFSNTWNVFAAIGAILAKLLF